jgi:D-sedoheptulose 7-phosphate isomerase
MSSDDKHLKDLYPYLYGEENRTDLNAALLESVRQKSIDSVETKQSFFAENSQQLVNTAAAIADVYRNNGRLFTMGNGGSSCDASHIAVEFTHPVTAGRSALTAINLVADTAMLTAVANDISFDHVFVRPLIAQANAGDCLIGISTSGNSDNLISAFSKARELRMTTIGLSGMDGGKMAQSASVDHCLVVASDSIHRVQECHVAIYHILWDLVHTLLADDRGKTTASSK